MCVGSALCHALCAPGCPQAMTLMEYLIKTGSERVSQQCKENMYAVQTLKDFQYVDRDGKDQGVNVREKAKQLVALLRDEDRLREERAHALKTKEKLAQTATGEPARGRHPALLPPGLWAGAHVPTLSSLSSPCDGEFLLLTHQLRYICAPRGSLIGVQSAALRGTRADT